LFKASNEVDAWRDRATPRVLCFACSRCLFRQTAFYSTALGLFRSSIERVQKSKGNFFRSVYRWISSRLLRRRRAVALSSTSAIQQTQLLFLAPYARARKRAKHAGRPKDETYRAHAHTHRHGCKHARTHAAHTHTHAAHTCAHTNGNGNGRDQDGCTCCCCCYHHHCYYYDQCVDHY
jgi:hypothetical protein